MSQSNSFKFKGTVDVAVTTALTDLLGTTGQVLGNQNPGCIVNLEIQNTGANDFTDFSIQIQDHPDGEFYDWLTGTDFTSTSNPDMLDCSVDPRTLVAGTRSHIVFRVRSAYAFKCKAKRTSATTATALGNVRS
jgi:hypothetical protein